MEGSGDQVKDDRQEDKDSEQTDKKEEVSKEDKSDEAENGDNVQKNDDKDKSSAGDANSCYHYDSNNVLVYTDPSTKAQFVLNAAGDQWVSREENKGDGKDASKEYEFDGQTYRYTDKEGNKYRWDLDKKDWQKVEEESEESELDDDATEEEIRERRYRKRKAQPGWGGGGDTFHTDPDTGAALKRDGKDGMIYEWDAGKNAWFPRIDEDFMAQYQMNYGFNAAGESAPTRPEEPKPEVESEAKKAKVEDKKKAAPQWFQEDEHKSTKVYISNLPNDIKEEDLIEFVNKCGMVEVDVRSNKPKLKIYRDSDGRAKGDALCTYVKVESVQLALQILDGSRLGDNEVKVERAKFEMKGEKYDPKMKPKKLRKKELEALKKKHEKMFAWEMDQLRGERSKRDKVIVIKNLFDPKEFDDKPERILEYTGHLREHCGKFGNVRKVVLYDKHPDGVAQVFFATAGEADQAIAMLDERLFFNQRVMRAQTWDGKTKFKVDETEEDEKKRLEKWDKFLEGGGDDEEDDKKDGDKK